jgi:CDP-glucose 4,6-dehydratase
MVNILRTPSADFWRGKRVLLTGHTGFKGSWLALWLHQLGAQVVGFSLPPDATLNLFEAAEIAKLCEHRIGDLCEIEQVQQAVRHAQPEIVFHLAAQALVRRSYEQPLLTFATNTLGTANLLDSLRSCASLKVVVAITTDKVYSNDETGRAYQEADALGGHDPYSASKAACELVIDSYRKSFFATNGVALASARAGNVIGGGDWSQDRLIPDAVRAWEAGQALKIRNPNAVRPWQHVIEPVGAYLMIAQALYAQPALAAAYNLGPDLQSTISVGEVAKLAAQSYGRAVVQMPEMSGQPHEAKLLHLDASLAKQALGIQPVWNVHTAVERTIHWYRQVSRGVIAAKQACEADIHAFLKEAQAV